MSYPLHYGFLICMALGLGITLMFLWPFIVIVGVIATAIFETVF